MMSLPENFTLEIVDGHPILISMPDKLSEEDILAGNWEEGDMIFTTWQAVFDEKIKFVKGLEKIAGEIRSPEELQRVLEIIQSDFGNESDDPEVE